MILVNYEGLISDTLDTIAKTNGLYVIYNCKVLEYKNGDYHEILTPPRFYFYDQLNSQIYKITSKNFEVCVYISTATLKSLVSMSKFTYDSIKSIWIPSPRKSLVSIISIPEFGAVNGYGDYTFTFLPPNDNPINTITYYRFTSQRTSIDPAPTFNVFIQNDPSFYIWYDVPDRKKNPGVMGIVFKYMFKVNSILCGDAENIYVSAITLSGLVVGNYTITPASGLGIYTYSSAIQIPFGNLTDNERVRVTFSTAPEGSLDSTCLPGTLFINGTVNIYIV